MSIWAIQHPYLTFWMVVISVTLISLTATDIFCAWAQAFSKKWEKK